MTRLNIPSQRFRPAGNLHLALCALLLTGLLGLLGCTEASLPAGSPTSAPEPGSVLGADQADGGDETAVQPQVPDGGPAAQGHSTDESADADQEATMKLFFDTTEIPVIWEPNATVAELAADVAEADITVSMHMYSDNEQVGPLGRSYPRSDVQMTTACGDIVLYSGNQIVVFYGPNTWAYTKLGTIQLDAARVRVLLANGNITLTLSR